MRLFDSIVQHLSAACVVASLALVTAGCGGEKTSGSAANGGPSSDFSPVIAEVGDVTITRAYFDYRYENLSPQEKSRYSGEGWEERYLDRLVEEILVTEQAEEEKYPRLREVEWRLDMARRSILYKAYYEANFQDAVQVSEEELREYYEQNKEAFRSMGRVFGHHIMTSSKDRIDRAWAELQDGKRFAEVAADYSEDEATRADGGTVGWFNRDGFVLGVGFNSDFTRIAFEMEPNSVHEPVQLGDKWHIIRIGAKVEDEQQSFEEVRERIERQLKPIVARERFDAFVRDQTRARGVKRFGEFQQETRSAEQLYQLAGESRNAHSRLHFYETLVDLYPQHERADDALFMVGFINSEDFGDVPAAMKAFRQLEREYPQSEFAEQARWMMQNVGGGIGLSGAQSPSSAEAAAEALQQKQ